MKKALKNKLVEWLRLFLLYLTNPHIEPTYVVHDRKVQQLAWTGTMYEYDIKHNFDRMVASHLADELIKSGMVQIEMEEDPEPSHPHGAFHIKSYKVNAYMFCILPPPSN